MSMIFFATPFRFFPSTRDDDTADRLHHRWTVLLLAGLGGLTMYVAYVGDPIHCWCPGEFTDAHCNYTEAYCWIMDTYYFPEDEYIPVEIAKRKEKEIKYYQWVPMILLFLAVCYKVPNIAWDMFNKNSGINIARIVQNYDRAKIGNERDDHIKNLTHVFARWLDVSSKKPGALMASSFSCFSFGKRMRVYLTVLYLCIKLFYIAVSFILLCIMNKFLGMEYMFYGIEVITNLVKNSEMPESARFPRVTLCDFEIRQLQNWHRYTVQCVLSINLFNEKIFAFLWFWFLLMALVGICSLIIWIKIILIPDQRMNFVNKYFTWFDNTKPFKAATVNRSDAAVEASTETLIDEEDDEQKSMDIKRRTQEKFCRDFLATDGVFALRLLEYNTSEMLVYDLIKNLWDKWGAPR